MITQDTRLTIVDLAKAVNKSEGYVRQHIFRGHLTASRKDGRRMVSLNEAKRWVYERGLSFHKEEKMSNVTHAIIVPFTVSNLATWCGCRVDSVAVAEDYIASYPEAVTCQLCMRAMRDAQKNLNDWIPRLSEKE